MWNVSMYDLLMVYENGSYKEKSMMCGVKLLDEIRDRDVILLI